MADDLSFLGDEARRELVFRIQKERKAEDERHTRDRGAVTMDHAKRGMVNTTSYFSALLAEDLKHLSELNRIFLGELFSIVESSGQVLSDQDVTDIIETRKRGILERARQMEDDLLAMEGQRGLPHMISDSVRQHVNELIQRDLVGEVQIRRGQLKRKREAATRERRRDILHLLIGSLIGVLGSLIVQWLQCQPRTPTTRPGG